MTHKGARRAMPRGEAHYRARLTEREVAAIRASDAPDSELATKYGVPRSTIIGARSGRSWAYLPGAHVRRPSPVALAGEGHHRAKLTEAAVRALRLGDVSHEALIESYGVSRMTIWKARKGITWKHLPL